jgi:hypothetical protein
MIERTGASEIRLRAERKAGELLAQMEKAKGGQPFQATGRGERPVGTLTDLGITRIKIIAVAENWLPGRSSDAPARLHYPRRCHPI